MKFYVNDFKNYEAITEKEWLLTNGQGGFSSSTIAGANTRRYHSLLTISKNPPVDRHMILSKLDETVIFEDMEMSLSSQRVNGHVICGYSHLQSVQIDDDITYTYLTRNAVITKKVSLIKGQNRVIVSYTAINKGEGLKLRIVPLFNSRYFHYINRKADINVYDQKIEKSRIAMSINDTEDISMEFDGCSFEPLKDTFYYSMEYDAERQRELDYVEDHYIPGLIIKEVGEGEQVSFSIDVYVGAKEALPENTGKSPLLTVEDRLERACEDFVVSRKSTGSYSIIAGYPWFNDWGRDAMISLPGILLETKKYETAAKVLETFARYEKDGIIPNMLPDGLGEPLYNTVDASLLYINALYQLYKKTGGYEYISPMLIDTAKRIIDNYRAGTRFDIKMDTDALISAGSEYTQLTWMDAKVGDFVVTPRHGKAVEINALWYNALLVMYEFTGDVSCRNLAENVFTGFNDKFVNTGQRSLYDVIDSGFDHKRSEDIRPNGLFAISLPYPVLDKGYWKGVFDKIWNELYTPYGLRSLSYMSRDYRGYYGGDQYERDTAYHQGTVWAWLMGPFIEAYLRIYDDKKGAMLLLEPLLHSLDDGLIGSIGEIFEGSYPHKQRGSFAQAWSVAEVLRVYNLIKGE